MSVIWSRLRGQCFHQQGGEKGAGGESPPGSAGPQSLAPRGDAKRLREAQGAGQAPQPALTSSWFFESRVSSSFMLSI